MTKLERKGWTWAAVPAGVFQSADLTHADVRVYCYLQWRAGNKEHAWPGVATVAADLHMSEASVKVSMSNLVKHDWIDRRRRYGGSTVTTVYEKQADCRAARTASGLANRETRTASGLANRTARIASGLAHEQLAGKLMNSQPDGRLNEIRERESNNLAAEKPAAARGDLREEQRVFLAEFCTLTGIPEPKHTYKDFGPLWAAPAARIVQALNGSSLPCLRTAVEKMRRSNLTIASPKSVEKTVLSVYGERHSTTGKREFNDD